MPILSEFEQREITLEIEASRGVAEADTPTSVLLVQDWTSQPYIGDDKTMNFDSLSSMKIEEVKKLNPQMTCGFNTPLTKPDSGVYPSWLNLLRACGMDVLDTAQSTPATPQLIVTQSTPSSMDTATIREYQAADAARNHLYTGVGGTGNISLDFIAGEIPMLGVSNFLSSYVRPNYVAPFLADKALLNAEECKAATVDGHVVSQLDGKDVCIQSLKMSNFDGRDLGIDQFFCRTVGGGARKAMQFEVIYLNPDWSSEFNPWALGESHETTNRVPFIFEHELGRVFIEKCQPINTEKVSFGKAGLKCIKQTLNVLEGFEMTFNY